MTGGARPPQWRQPGPRDRRHARTRRSPRRHHPHRCRRRRRLHRARQAASPVRTGSMSRPRDLLARADVRALDAVLALALATELVLECWLDSGVSHADRFPSSVAAVLLVSPIIFRRALARGGSRRGHDRRRRPGLVRRGPRRHHRLGHARDDGGAHLLARPSATARKPVPQRSCSAGRSSASSSSSWPVERSTGRAAICSCSASPSSHHGCSGGWYASAVDGSTAFRALAMSAAAAHDEATRSAIAHERDRIRRELEDIIAHTVSAMVVQAGGARQLLRDDPERARQSILTSSAQAARRSTISAASSACSARTKACVRSPPNPASPS